MMLFDRRHKAKHQSRSSDRRQRLPENAFTFVSIHVDQTFLCDALHFCRFRHCALEIFSEQGCDTYLHKRGTRDHDGMANLKIGSTLIMQFCFLLSNPLQAVPFLLRIYQHKTLQ
jgi:hypothetical protein